MSRESVYLTVTALLAFASYSAAFYPSALKIVSQVPPKHISRSGRCDEGWDEASPFANGRNSTSRAKRLWGGDFSRRGAIGLAALLPAALSLTPVSKTPLAVAADEFPWQSRGGMLDDVLPESVLVKSLPLNYKSIKSMGSALDGINELRGLNILRGAASYCKDGQVEADLSFVSPPVREEVAEAEGLNSTRIEEEEEEELSYFRWTKIKAIADDVRGIFDKEKDALPFALAIRPNTTIESQNRRRERFTTELRLLNASISSLQNATKRENIQDTLYYQAQSLLHLGHLGELMVAKFPFVPPKADSAAMDDYYNLPRLFGRAQVDFIIKEMSEDGGGKPSGSDGVVGNCSVVADGFNSPLSAGNFVDLCQRGFYNRLPLRKTLLGTGKVSPSLDVLVAGTYKAGFVDPITGKQRRVPLEIVRDEKDGPMPFYGQARNTGLFTRAPPLLSFKTPRAVGLLHPDEDGNGANSEFFFLRDDPRCLENAKYLDGRYALVGYIVAGVETLGRLNDRCYIDSCTISWGLDHFVRSRVSFIDILLQGEDR